MSRTNKVLFTFSFLLTVLSLWISFQISYAAPAFEELFHNFGTEISDKTKIVLEYHYLGLIAPIIALIASVYFIKVNLDQTYKNLVYILSVITFVITVNWHFYASDALYTPIMQMEAK